MGQKHARLRPDLLDDLVKTTAFTDTEVQDWYKGFLKDCPTGHLTLDEFKHIYTKFFPHGEPSRFSEHLFRSFDRNQDGLIDFREFLSTLSITSRGDLDKKMRWAFNFYDLDRDGYLSRQDLCEVISSIYALVGSAIRMPEDELTPERRSDKILSLMDANHDDRLSYEEFVAGVKSNPAILRLLTMSSGDLGETATTTSVKAEVSSNGHPGVLINGNGGMAHTLEPERPR